MSNDQNNSRVPESETYGLQVSTFDLVEVFCDLRHAMDVQISALLACDKFDFDVTCCLARLRGIFDTYCDLATQWRPADTLRALHADIERHLSLVTGDNAPSSVSASRSLEASPDLPAPGCRRRELQQPLAEVVDIRESLKDPFVLNDLIGDLNDPE